MSLRRASLAHQQAQETSNVVRDRAEESNALFVSTNVSNLHMKAEVSQMEMLQSLMSKITVLSNIVETCVPATKILTSNIATKLDVLYATEQAVYSGLIAPHDNSSPFSHNISGLTVSMMNASTKSMLDSEVNQAGGISVYGFPTANQNAIFAVLLALNVTTGIMAGIGGAPCTMSNVGLNAMTLAIDAVLSHHPASSISATYTDTHTTGNPVFFVFQCALQVKAILDIETIPGVTY